MIPTILISSSSKALLSCTLRRDCSTSELLFCSTMVVQAQPWYSNQPNKQKNQRNYQSKINTPHQDDMVRNDRKTFHYIRLGGTNEHDAIPSNRAYMWQLSNDIPVLKLRITTQEGLLNTGSVYENLTQRETKETGHTLTVRAYNYRKNFRPYYRLESWVYSKEARQPTLDSNCH